MPPKPSERGLNSMKFERELIVLANPDRFDPRLWPLAIEQNRRLASLDRSPEGLLRGNQDRLIDRVSVNR